MIKSVRGAGTAPPHAALQLLGEEDSQTYKMAFARSGAAAPGSAEARAYREFP